MPKHQKPHRVASDRGIVQAAATIVLLLLSGCSSGKFEEHYHFPGTLDGHTENYYRVEVVGRVNGNQLRYLSGFFDARALDRYFNTFSQPEGSSLARESEDGATPAAANLDPEEERSADPEGRGRKLVLLLSQNSEAIAEQIGSLAQSEAFANIVGQLIFADDIAEIEGARAEAARMTDLLDDAKARAQQLGPILADGSLTGDAAKEQLLQYVNAVAASLGRRTPFDSYEDAVRWLNENRAELIGGNS